MATFEERIYSLGVDALAEQERQVAEVRGRASFLLAAAAVVPSLLAKAVFHGNHPHGVGEIASVSVGLGGAAGVLVFTVLLLRPYELGFSMKAGATYRELWSQGVLEQPMVDLCARRSARRAAEGECEDGQAVGPLPRSGVRFPGR